jgi:hypothetical protein
MSEQINLFVAGIASLGVAQFNVLKYVREVSAELKQQGFGGVN